jgi:hypothetical protein
VRTCPNSFRNGRSSTMAARFCFILCTEDANCMQTMNVTNGQLTGCLEIQLLGSGSGSGLAFFCCWYA